MIRSTLGTLTKQTMGRVRRRTSTKQRSMILVVRSFVYRCRGEAEKRQQLRQIALQWSHHRAIHRLPASAEGAKSGFGLTPAVGAIDRLGIGFHRVMVATAYFIQDIAHLVHPAALMQCPGRKRFG